MWIRVLLLIMLGVSALSGPPEQKTSPLARFRAQEIDRSLKVGYAVSLLDLNRDGSEDILVVDTERVIWFENPDWKLRAVIQGQTRPDNVCISPYDIDGDGRMDLALGAGWRGTNTRDPGTLQWLRQGENLDQAWDLYPIDTEYSVHRIRFADLDGDSKAELISAPLLGPNTTAPQNWSEAAVRLRAYRIPADPLKEAWQSKVLDESLHVVHNFWPADVNGDGELDLLTASYEGVSLLKRGPGNRWARSRIGSGNQDNPQGRRGSSEIKLGRLRSGRHYLATIEPWHGHQVVVYTRGAPADLWARQVIDEQLKWGHAVWCADLNGDGDEEIIIGVRDALSEQVSYGVNVYYAQDGTGTSWHKQVVDHGGVAVEDLAAADLNRDGRIDIVAVGRATGNVKIYWNGG